jgi:hypothetical protein
VETTETIENDGSIESALESILAPTEETVDTTEEETQITDEATDVEDSAESEEVDTEESEEEDYDTESDEEVEESDEDYDQVEDAVQDAPSNIKVKIDGNEVEVTLDELKQGYSGQKYVQKGMQEAATQRKEAEQVYSALLNERQQINQLYQQLQQGGIAQAPIPPSRELFNSDPIGYMEEKLNYDETKVAYDGQMAQLQAVSNQSSQAEKVAKQTYLRQEMQTLQQKIPEFANSNTAGKIKERLVQVGREHYGYSAEEIGQVMDHRAIQVLNDAMKYRDIMSGKAKAVAKTKKARPIVKAGAKRVNDSATKVRKRQQAKLQKSGSIDDALDLILNT